MENRAAFPDHPNIGGAAPPNAMQKLRHSTWLRGPGGSIPMHDRSRVADGPDVIMAAAPKAAHDVALWQRVFPAPAIARAKPRRRATRIPIRSAVGTRARLRAAWAGSARARSKREKQDRPNATTRGALV